VRFTGGREARVAFGVKARCSHGFHRHLRFGDARPLTGCLVFHRPAGAEPRTLRFALESNPVSEGGLWRLG
jgi:hypothetical protein